MAGVTTEPRVIAETDGPVGRITFDNPARRNAMTLAMWQGLHAAVDRFAADPELRVVVLRGAGEKAFVAGADISEFEALRNSADGAARYNATAEAADRALHACPKPTIAAIRGACVGGGLGIAMACDLRIASEDARFGITAARLGLGYGADGVAKLVSALGPSATAEILFTGDIFDSHAARDLGILRQVVPGPDFDATVEHLAGRISAAAPLTVRAAKAAIRAVERGAPQDKALARMIAACFDSADYAEGRAAFAEKRAPVFKGR